MAFEVRFWTFTKEVNSTAIPRDADGFPCQCVANNGIDIINPIISVRIPSPESLNPAPPIGGEAPVWNYCHVPDMNRYYFVENWSWENGLWHAHLSVDVLATYKAQIGNMSAYVLRASRGWDGDIPDGMYPAKHLYTYDTKIATTGSSGWVVNPRTGTYVIGVLGKGSTKFYAMPYTSMVSFFTNLLSDTYATQVIGALQLGLYQEAKAIIDPLQYITTVTYIPVSFTAGTYTSQAIEVGYGSITVTCAEVGASGIDVTESVLFGFAGLPWHPQMATRGTYLNYAPWTRRYLWLPPIGLMELDTTEMQSALSITCQIDMISGMGRFGIIGMTRMNEIKTQVGVPIQMSQIIDRGTGVLSWINKGANLVSQIMGGITGGGGTGGMIGNVLGAERGVGLAGGGIVGGIASGVSGVSAMIMSAIEAKIPTANTVGSTGGFVDLVGVPTLLSVFTHQVDDSVSTRGRPVCKQLTLSTLAATNNDSGYILVADPDVSGIPGTAMERNMVASFLTGGFYYA